MNGPHGPTKRTYQIPETTAHDPAQAIVAQINLRGALWRAASAGYTPQQLRAEVERCIEIRPVREPA